MVAMDSMYENHHPQKQALDSGISFGRITRVFSERRMCEVKTFMGGQGRSDQHIPECQWLSLDGHPDGDESSVIPRVNSYGLIFYIGGQPFIFGFFKPTDMEDGSAGAGKNAEELNEGDRVLKTAGGNKIILRAHGEIQIESTELCRTIYFPDKNIINTLCRNYEFDTDGGLVRWTNIDEDDDSTLYKAEYRNNVKRQTIIIEQKGKVDGEDDFIYKMEVGTGDPEQEIVKQTVTKTVKADGTTELFIRAPGATDGYKYTIKPDGTTVMNIAGKTTMTIMPTGATKLDVNSGKVTIDLTADGKMTIVTKGDTSVDCGGKLAVKTKADVSVESGGKLDIKSAGKATIKADMIDLDGGGKLEGVLTSPNTVSQFTGLPLQGFSSTVKVSI